MLGNYDIIVKFHPTLCNWQEYLLFHGATIFHHICVPHVYSFICDGHLDCFYILNTVNNVAMSMGDRYEKLFELNKIICIKLVTLEIISM